ncbi:hypothetical protein E2562_010738 [Oryza meyeriana var. granulata]|uniref:DUF3741 domain-containing protein n=1 Tax=Oryza meyeriana var. granulata TaxID=110450 RepID=A0A6G1EW61_9ORYZ|nr:hypothetical protein E2562_010738 [Oryza meyeriana var. granulata]
MADEVAFETARKIIMHPLYTPRSSPWLDLKVFYVRVSNCEVDESAPDRLTLNHIPLSPDTVIEVNGQRSSMHTEFISSSLRRDRVDKMTEEATFVSTDSIRMTGCVRFQVFDKNDLLLTGDLELCSANGVVGESKNSSKRWNMKCQPASSCNGFLKGKLSTGSESVHPVIEVSELQNPKSETDVDVDYNSLYSRQDFIEGEDECIPDETPHLNVGLIEEEEGKRPAAGERVLFSSPSEQQAMDRVPDLGSDFAQKLLLDLRRRRERLGFDSPAAAQRTSSSNAAASRDSHSSSQRPLRSQKPQEGAPRVGRAEATANRSYKQSGNAIVRAGKPRHRDAPTANSHQIVPFQGGGSSKQKPANNIDVQMALALALSNRGKLQNIQLVSRDGSIFFRDPDHGMQVHHRGGENHLVPPNAHVGKVAIGVQKLNDILMGYSSGGGARDTSRRSSVDIGRELFSGAMDLEESLSMLVMLQDASDYMEGSGNGKVLLLEGKENRKNSTRSPSSARLVEIVDEDSETEQAKNSKSLSMQIVPHNKTQSYTPNSTSVLQLSTVTGNSKNNASKADKDDSKVRMPSVIAKLMGLENLPSTKVVSKGMEKFVKPEAVFRKDRRANVVGGKLPIQIVGSERVFSKGQNMNLLPGEWKIGLKNSEEYRSANLQVSNSSSIPAVDKQTRQTMRQMLSKIENTERRGSLGQVMHEDKKPTEETNQQKVVNVGCRTDAGKKMDFLKRFRKNSGSRQVTEEKQIIQEKNTTSGKKQATSMKQLLGRDNEDKSKRTRDKFNKENLATTEIKNAGRGKNGKTDQRKRQSYNKQTDIHSMAKKSQNCREMKSKEGIRNLEYKKSTKSEATQLKRLLYTAEIHQENGKHGKENDIGKPSDSTHDNGGVSEQSTGMVKDSRTTEMVSSDQFMKQITEVSTTGVHANDISNVVDQSVPQINDDTSTDTASETTQIPETFTEGEKHQNMQLVEVQEQPMDDLSNAKESSNPTDLQDQKMPKALVRYPVPVHFVNASADKWSEKGSSLFSDIAREVIRKKGKRTEAIVEVSMKPTANMKLQYLDDLIMELDADIESLNISKKSQQQGDDCTAENLRMILHRDMQNNHPDANSMWDFGWNRISDLPIERNEVVRDLEKNILGGIITDVARELIELSVRHGCCACEA